MKTYTIHLIRHGLTEGNEKGQYIGVTDLPISTAGINELERLRDAGAYPPVQVCYASPLLRCRQSLAVIYPEAASVLVEDLRECNFGVFEGKTAAELEADPDYGAWTAGRLPAPPGGESTDAFTERVCAGFAQMVRHMMENGITQAAAVLHGGVIMRILSVCGLPQLPFFQWMCGSGRGYSVRITPSVYLRSGMVEVLSEIPPAGWEMPED
ncbi:MAG TPA: histidine phosphatase family protein [Firmicutes bacterium]|nr:histidine phosphatase family protein [Bacillota bacterium]